MYICNHIYLLIIITIVIIFCNMKTGAATAALLLRSEHDSDVDSTRIFMPSSSEIDARIEKKPLIPRTTSYTNGNSSSNQKQRRRRVASETSIVTLSLGRRRHFGRMTIAPSETFLLTRLTFKLLGFLG